MGNDLYEHGMSFAIISIEIAYEDDLALLGVRYHIWRRTSQLARYALRTTTTDRTKVFGIETSAARAVRVVA